MQLPAVPPPWVADAICPRTEDPDTWFPAKGKPSLHTRKIAKEICTSCPVKQACLDYAIDNDEQHGIWGSHTRNERIKIKKRRLELVTA